MTPDNIIRLTDSVDNMQRLGRFSFSLKEIYSLFPEHSKASLKNSLTRLARKRRIISVWKGFYAIIPIEYSSQGNVPAVLYINDLMKYLGRQYYISLLNAAVFYGAAHQRPQEFCVVTNSGSLRSTEKKGIKIYFISKKEIPTELLIQKKTQTGYVNVSSPELTATDLVQYENKVGGLNRVATVLSELADELHFIQVPKLFFEYIPVPVIQRLGYLLEVVLGYNSIAQELMEVMNRYKKPVRNTPLKIKKSTSGCKIDKKWRIIINEQIEIDE